MRACLIFLLACVFSTAGATAQEYPNRPIRIIVPFAPGGGTDVLGRIIAQRLQEQWGQGVVIENQPGASGGLGTRGVAKADPDGYTLLMASTGALMAASAMLAPEGHFDVTQHFAPVTVVAAPPYLVVVNPKVQASSIADLIKLGHDKPNALSFGSSGVGAASHLAGVLFQNQARIEMLHVPYKGTGPAVTDLLGGRIDVMFAPPPTVQAFVEAGKLKALATTGGKRSRFMPGLPTVAEGGLPQYQAVGWFGLLAPAHTPDALVMKLNHAVVAMMETQEFKDKLAALGAEPQPQTPAEFARFINDDLAMWTELVHNNGIGMPGGK
jgi:tripartite-type tricarboxylate transporter receptor subunit TctC